MDSNSNEGNIVLGIDIGGTNVRLALVTEKGKLLYSTRYPGNYETLENFTGKLFDAIDAILSEQCSAKKPIGAGIGVKALVDDKRQRVIKSSMISILVEYDLCDEIRKRYDIKAVMDNDVNAATIAERLFGAGRYVNDFAYINVGTGTAAGVIAECKLLRGKQNFAGELGTTVFQRDCEEAPLFTLESVASGKGIEDEARRLMHKHLQSELHKRLLNSENVPASDILQSYKEGNDTLAKVTVDNALSILSFGIYNLEMITNSQLYILGGGVVNDWFLNQVNMEIKNLYKKMNVERSVKLQISELGAEDVGVLGAASILLDSM